MSGPEKPRPRHGEEAQAALEQRRAREAAALRENLRKRKQQARGREGAAGDTVPVAKDKEGKATF